jgi:hypothetical protein
LPAFSLFAFSSAIVASPPDARMAQRMGIRLQTWLEASSESWSSYILCCAVTNLRPLDYVYLDFGDPPLFVELLDSHGQQILRDRSSIFSRTFYVWGSCSVRAYEGRLLAFHSMVVAIPLAQAFRTAHLENSQVKVTWAPDPLYKARPEDLTCTLNLSAKPRLIPPPTTAPRALGAISARTGQDRAGDVASRIGQDGFFRPETFRSVSWTESIWWMCRFPLMLLLAAAVVFLSWRSLRGGKRRASRGFDFMN